VFVLKREEGERERKKKNLFVESNNRICMYKSGKKMIEVLLSIRDSKAKNKEVTIGHKSARQFTDKIDYLMIEKDLPVNFKKAIKFKRLFFFFYQNT